MRGWVKKRMFSIELILPKYSKTNFPMSHLLAANSSVLKRWKILTILATIVALVSAAMFLQCRNTMSKQDQELFELREQVAYLSSENLLSREISDLKTENRKLLDEVATLVEAGETNKKIAEAYYVWVGDRCVETIPQIIKNIDDRMNEAHDEIRELSLQIEQKAKQLNE